MDKLLVINERYLPKICQYHDIFQGFIGGLALIKNCDDHNNIVKLNGVWSTHPVNMPADRTMSTKLPFKQHIPRPWKIPSVQRTLDEAMMLRAKSIASLNQTVNVLWSGGIDSSALLTAFLQHVDHAQLRIIYSPWSTYEHPEMIQYLQSVESLELVDISGTRYLDWDFDGVLVTGDSGDEMMASIDSSFLENNNNEILHQPWIDFVYKQTNNTDLVEFCQKHFALSGREIVTVLEARWWFYACFKVRSILNQKLELLFDSESPDLNRLIGFYDCEEFESYIYWNIEDCITNNDYSQWKQVLKNYANNFKNFERWYRDAIKNHSIQVNVYVEKKRALKQRHWLALWTDGTRTTTASLPVLTKKEYFQTADIGWVFNHEHS